MLNFMFRGIVTRSPLSIIRSGAALNTAQAAAVARTRLSTTHTSLTSLIQSTSKLNLNTQQARHATLNQIKRGGGKIKRPERPNKTPHLDNCPIRKGVILRVMIMKPKKPNSAQRKVCRVRLTTGHVISAYIPGEGHNAQEHSVIYVRGGRVQDLPGIKYHCVRGALDLAGVANKTTARSKYGVKKPTKA